MTEPTQPVKPALQRTGRRRRWILAAGVIVFVWVLRGFISVITPDNPNPYITPLAVGTTLLALLAPWVTTGRFGRSRMADLTLVLGSVLLASGAALLLGPAGGDAHRIILAAHLIGGVLILLPVHLYLIGHLGDALRRRPVNLVRSGIGSLVLVLACVWTGALMTFVQAREMEPLALPHQLTGWALLLLCIVHVRRGRAVLAQQESPPPARLRFAVEGIAPGLLLLLLAAGIGLATPDAGSWDRAAGALPEEQAVLTQARTAHGGLLSGERWNWEPATCSSPGGYCHVDNVTQWKRSAHARSANPAYLAVLARFEATRPGQSAYCAGCHEPRSGLSTGETMGSPPPPRSPAATLSVGVEGTFVSDGATGQATTIPPVPPGELGEGVGCQVCHRSGLREPGERHTGGYVMHPLPAELVRTAAVPFFNFPMVLADLDRHRELLLGDQSLGGVDGCASCHVHRVPDSVHPAIPGLVVADQRTPFIESAAAAEGGTCVLCHMPRIYGPLDPTWTRSHAFPSGNTGVPWLLGLPERVAENQAFLSDGKVELDLACDRLPDSGHPQVSCRVTVRNVGVGHDFPAGPRDLVEVWVELVTEAAGGAVTQLGRIDASGEVVAAPMTFRELLFDGDGQQLDLHEFWLATRAEGRGSIGPGEEQSSEAIVLRADGPLEVRARLRHRRYNADFVRAAFGPEHAMAPVTDLAAAEVVVR
ncbi:MAG: hypothetical protein VX498_00320 [Myxococcota bacterium]|nr:hypothetical protein [Myxococcota bacterium]